MLESLGAFSKLDILIDDASDGLYGCQEHHFYSVHIFAAVLPQQFDENGAIFAPFFAFVVS